ncbi:MULTISPECIES: hemerythrin domain-containing protein [unclassified Sphingomonas]|uniref:hemerythrin domain-containing protein n=1 Tax=unclassified Sphingomonas TaxID=196159 RepID=UPI0008338897|nr:MULTISPECIES: hemerythrin domain-containing protein [unclassified Sphingomonas]MCH4894249.1 hemerythrin domain-containing protein [Sphingomonas sp. SFZ2018-12]
MATTIERDPQGRFVSNNDDAVSPASSNRNFGVLAGAVGAGAALGVLAMLGRKAAVQAPTALAGDWAEALAAEHKAVLKIFDAIEATAENATGRRTMLLTQLKHALTKHAIEEENVIYPALRDAGRRDEADALNKEHGDVKHYLYQLDQTPKNATEWLAIVRRFRADIERHMTEEETELFPALRAQLSEEKNKALKAAMNKEGFKVA